MEGDLRFISHHDTLRLLERALARTGLPVRFSEGFNPRPRISLALPRPVGVASSDELLVVEFSEPVDEAVLHAGLVRQLPDGICLRSVERLADHDHRRPREARYVLPLEPALLESTARRVVDFLGQTTWMIRRTAFGGGRPRAIDLRAFVREMSVDDARLTWTQSISQDGTARITEVLEAVGLEPQVHLSRVRRDRVRYTDEPPGRTGG
jgi:radical SAM-linked protein